MGTRQNYGLLSLIHPESGGVGLSAAEVPSTKNTHAATGFLGIFQDCATRSTRVRWLRVAAEALVHESPPTEVGNHSVLAVVREGPNACLL